MMKKDGFGVVLSQALASGLSIVRTDRTGALAHAPALARRIKVVLGDNLCALIAAISELRARLETGFFRRSPMRIGRPFHGPPMAAAMPNRSQRILPKPATLSDRGRTPRKKGHERVCPFE
jgi:hypothetical protein